MSLQCSQDTEDTAGLPLLTPIFSARGAERDIERHSFYLDL